MKQALRRLGKFYGLSDKRPLAADRNGRLPGDAGFELGYLQPSLMREGIVLCLATLIATLMLGIVFDWPLSELMGGIAAGVPVWGAVWYVLDTGPRVPNGELTPAPAHAVVAASSGATARRALYVLTVMLALAWFADQADVGGFLFPGMFSGLAAAHLAAAALVSRWEQEHGRRVVTAAGGSGHGGLFAVSADRSQAPPRPVA